MQIHIVVRIERRRRPPALEPCSGSLSTPIPTINHRADRMPCLLHELHEQRETASTY